LIMVVVVEVTCVTFWYESRGLTCQSLTCQKLSYDIVVVMDLT